jgi:hypothetical protein
MEEEGVPSTALREVSLLQMLSESAFVVRCVRDTPDTPPGPARLARPFPPPIVASPLPHQRAISKVPIAAESIDPGR